MSPDRLRHRPAPPRRRRRSRPGAARRRRPVGRRPTASRPRGGPSRPLVMACVAALVALTPCGRPVFPRASVPAVRARRRRRGAADRLPRRDREAAPQSRTTAAPGVTAALVPSGDAASTYPRCPRPASCAACPPSGAAALLLRAGPVPVTRRPVDCGRLRPSPTSCRGTSRDDPCRASGGWSSGGDRRRSRGGGRSLVDGRRSSVRSTRARRSPRGARHGSRRHDHGGATGRGWAAGHLRRVARRPHAPTPCSTSGRARRGSRCAPGRSASRPGQHRGRSCPGATTSVG